ncbi:Retrovirus-related Pol polyprotein from transposon TNT 1-94 [Capsicum chinense]|nr:Retrovirus-related Pol polyprotein from transposon TNT 1-94 [Capsicum chinense]
MSKSKSISTPLAANFKISSEFCPKTEEEIEIMSNVPYSSAVGSIMYAMVYTRPDLAYAVSMVSRYMHNPRKYHWDVVKWIFRYLKGTVNLGLVFDRNKVTFNNVVGFVDFDYGGDLDRRRSLSRYIFTLCSGSISWKASLQSIAALSTTEAEYVAATEGVKEATWLRGLILELGLGSWQLTSCRKIAQIMCQLCSYWSPVFPGSAAYFSGAFFFSDVVPIRSGVEFHFIISFAINYTTSSPTLTNGQFNIFWDMDNPAPSAVSAIKDQYSNVKVALSLGRDSVRGSSIYFNPSSVDSWVSNVVSCLTDIIKQYNLDGIDIDYEHFQEDPDTFVECIGKLITTLKSNRVISFAFIAPFDDDEVQSHYKGLWKSSVALLLGSIGVNGK